MSTVGIVCEYNPFHKGHLYQIEQTRKLTGAEYIICFMSGNFLQRGIPALADKYVRAEAAIRCGIDAIFEIPSVYSSSSARDYATAAVTMMNRSKVIDHISFGAETDDIDLLTELAEIIENEPPNVSAGIREKLASGKTYGQARAESIIEYLCADRSDGLSEYSEADPAGSSAQYSKDHLVQVLSSPNNILAIEYLAAIKRTGSKLKPVIVKRVFSEYNSNDISNDICSASAIRELLMQNEISAIHRHIPDECYNTLLPLYKVSFPVFDDDLSYMLSAARIFYGSDYSSAVSRTDIVDMDEDIFNRFKKVDFNMSFSETAQAMKCRNYTLTHIQRALLHFIMQLQREDYEEFKANGWIFYLRLLGLNVRAGSIIKQIKKASDIPVITRVPEISSALNDTGKKMFDYDLKAAEIYNTLIYHSYKTKPDNEYTRTIPITGR